MTGLVLTEEVVMGEGGEMEVEGMEVEERQLMCSTHMAHARWDHGRNRRGFGKTGRPSTTSPSSCVKRWCRPSHLEHRKGAWQLQHP